MDFLYFIKILTKRIWMILLVVVVSVGATFFFTSSSEKVYKSTARLATGIVDNPDEDGKYLPRDKIEAKFSNLVEILNSRKVMNLVSYRLFLHDINNNTGAFRNASLLDDQFTRDQINDAKIAIKLKYDSLSALSYANEKDIFLTNFMKTLGYDYESLRASINAQRHKDTDYLRVEFSSEDADLSAFAVNALCEEFVRYYKTIRADQKNSAVAFYNKMVDEKMQLLNSKKDELNRFKLDNRLVDLSNQQSAILQQIRDLEMLREGEKSKIPGYQNKLENVTTRQEEDQVAASEMREKNRKINNLRNEINYLNDKYISAGSKDKKLKEQIDKLKGELRQAIDESTNYSTPVSTPNDLEVAKTESQLNLHIAQTSVYSIDQKIQSLKNELAVLVSLEPKVSALTREIQLAEESHQEAITKLSEANLEAMRSESRLRQEEFGLPAKSPEPTKQLVYSVFSGMVSLSFCIVLLFVLEYLDISMKTPAQFERFTNLKLLGFLNQINFINFNLDVNFIDINLESIFHNVNESPQLETFKQLIRKTRFEIESTDSKRFLITSTRPREGKTFLLISLAYSLSLNNKRVLLIDTNFKNNTLTNMLSAKPALEKHFNHGLVKDDIITKSKLKGIDVLGCYEGNYSPSEVFSQTNFHNLINDLAQHYDFIFLEGAALNDYSDSKELISSVEKVICVFSTNTVIKEQDKTSIAYLRGLGDKFMGAILNKVDMSNLG